MDASHASSLNSALQRCWRQLVAVDLLYKLLAFILLTPFVGILFRVGLMFSGRSVLMDQDILYFFLGPIGWVCAIGVAALWLVIAALRQAALLGVIIAAELKIRPGVRAALMFALAHILPLFKATVRMVSLTLLSAAPFAVGLGVVYWGLLSEFDINFYLTQKPPSLWIAAALSSVILLGLATVAIRLAARWLFVLPIILFEGVSAPEALKASRRRVTGKRRTLIIWIIIWAIASLLLSVIATGAVTMLGIWIVPAATASIWLLLFAVGSILMLWGGVNLGVNLIGAIAFAAMLSHLYQTLGRAQPVALSRVEALASDREQPGWQLTTGRLLAVLIVGAIGAAAVGFLAMHSVQLEDQVQIAAHRGASANAPENTLAAIEKAITAGADWAEIDVQQTADGHVVVFHDSDFKKVAGDSRKIWAVTFDALKDIDVGSHFDKAFSQARIPLLHDVLQACKGRIGVMIELKYYGIAKALERQLASKVVALVKAAQMESEVVLMSLKIDAVKQVKALEPGWRVGLLAAVAAGNLARTEADFLAVNAGMADRRFIRAARRRAKPVMVWTVNDPVSMSTMIGRGVDGIITDKPALVRSVLAQRTTLEASERLLLQLAELFGLRPQFAEQ